MKLKLLMLLLTLGLATAAWSKSAGTVTDLSGSPTFSMDGGKTLKDLKIGMSVEAGTFIHTGDGLVSIILSDGSLTRLGHDTEITLQSHNPEDSGGGSIFNLAKGFARFLVTKLQPGRHFEVQTANAVAAVKGTDWEVSWNDNGNTEVKVFDHNGQGAVELSNLNGDLNFLLHESQQGSFDGLKFTHGDFSKDEQNGENGKFGNGNGSGDSGQGVDTGQDLADKASQDAKTDANFDKVYKNVINGVVNDLLVNATVDQQDRTADLEEGRMIVDVNGDATMVTNKVSLPEPQIVVKEAWATRDATATQTQNIGTTYVNETAIYNQALPYDWPLVARSPLGSVLTDANGYPLYYKVGESFEALNPAGDALDIATTLDAPIWWVDGNDTRWLLQGFDQGIEITPSGGSATPVGFASYHASDTDPGTHVSINGLINVGDDFVEEGEGDGIQSVFTYFDYTLGQQLQENITLIDDTGTEPEISPFGENNPSDPSAYKGLASTGLNIEISFTSSLVNGGETPFMDFVLLPGYFDYFDMVLPAPQTGGCDCE